MLLRVTVRCLPVICLTRWGSQAALLQNMVRESAHMPEKQVHLRKVLQPSSLHHWLTEGLLSWPVAMMQVYTTDSVLGEQGLTQDFRMF